MTIEEVKEAKTQLDGQVAKLFDEFSLATGFVVKDVEINVKRSLNDSKRYFVITKVECSI